MAYLSNITEAVGGTPLVRINRVISGPATVLAKVEAFEPAGSVKDRIALSIVRAAEASGALKPGGTIIEATSGNTGVGLAMVGAALGYKVVITMPETMSKERRAIMRAFGAELVLTTEGGVAGAVKRAEEIQAATPNSVLASQFSNPANPEVHRETTAREILEQAGDLDVFVAGIGTGGTLTGGGQVLRAQEHVRALQGPGGGVQGQEVGVDRHRHRPRGHGPGAGGDSGGPVHVVQGAAPLEVHLEAHGHNSHDILVSSEALTGQGCSGRRRCGRRVSPGRRGGRRRPS